MPEGVTLKGMLDHRVYRGAFLPTLVALFVVAFSLSDPPTGATTRLAPDAFDVNRAFGTAAKPPRNSLREMASSFPSRRPGSSGDAGVADRVATWFESTGFANEGGVRRFRHEGDTIDGESDLEVVMARRQGLANETIVLIAHRDARSGRAPAELSGTAGLMEIARVLADRDLRKTVVLASVSGGSGGFAGARQVVDAVDTPVEAVLVLGDLAGTIRKPWVVPWSRSGEPAPHAVRRTVEAALRAELGQDAGGAHATGQWARRALPLTVSEQGPLVEAGMPAVLVSASGELGPAPGDRVSARRLGAFGRGVLRALTAFEEAPTPPRAGDGIITMDRLLPEWAVRLLVGALMLPALLAALDAFFRVRRRRLPMGRWLVWVGSFGLPFLLAWAWIRLLGLTGAVTALPSPAAGGTIALGGGGAVALASVALVIALGFVGLRPLVVRRAGARGDAATGGAAAAMGLVLALLVLVVWVANPYAAAVLLPAAHLWLLASAPEPAWRRPFGALAVAGGLLLPALLAVHYVSAFDLGPIEAMWTAFGIVAGGTLGIAAALALSLFGAALCATIAVLLARRRATAAAPPEPLRTRGPSSYAGPGSLGGTESALRR